jgi:hypothetical protein
LLLAKRLGEPGEGIMSFRLMLATQLLIGRTPTAGSDNMTLDY